MFWNRRKSLGRRPRKNMRLGPTCEILEHRHCLSSNTQPFQWVTTGGGAENDYGQSVATFTDGSAIVTGSFSFYGVFGETTLQSYGNNDVFIGKVNRDGSYAWVTRGGGNGYDTGRGVATFADGSAVVTGTFSGTATFGAFTLNSNGDDDAFIAKVNADGTYAWAVAAGGNNVSQGGESGNAVATLPDGSAIVAGTFCGTAAFGSTTLVSTGNHDGFIAKVTPAGGFSWAVKVGGIQYDSVADVAVAADGSSFLTGSFFGSATCGAKALSSPGGSFAAFAAKLNPDGTCAWATSLGSSQYSFGHGIALCGDGSTRVVGSFGGTVSWGTQAVASSPSGDTYFAALTPAGNCTWLTVASGTGGGDYSCKVAVLSDGASVVTGSFTGTGVFGSSTIASSGVSDLFIARLTPSGAFEWARKAGSTSSSYGDLGGDVALRPDGIAVVTGAFNGSAVFGATTVASAGQTDMVLFTVTETGAFAGAPGGVTSLVASPGNSQVTLNWTPPVVNGNAPITDYVIQYRISGDVTWTTVDDGVSIATGALVTALTNGSSYDFRVAASNAAGVGVYVESNVVTPKGVPLVVGKPTYVAPGLVFTYISLSGDPNPPAEKYAVSVGSGVCLYWSEGKGLFPQNPNDPKLSILNYEVEYSTDGVAWTTVMRTPSATCYEVVDGLDADAIYMFRVRGINGFGAGRWGAFPFLVRPGRQTTYSTLDMTWPAPAGDGGSAILGYAVEVSADAGITWQAVNAGGPPAPENGTVVSPVSSIFPAAIASRIRVNGLEYGTTYRVRVAALNAIGQGPWSEWGAMQTRSAATPAKPSTPNVSWSDAGVDVTGLDGGTSQIGVIVLCRALGDVKWRVASIVLGTDRARINDVAAEQGYAFKVIAANGYCVGPASDETTVYGPLYNAVPDLPTGVAAAPGNGRVTLAWAAPTADGGSPITDYTTQYSSNGGTNWTTFPHAASTATTATVTGLTNGTSYVFRVAAVNVAGTGGWSATSAAVTPRTVPAMPTIWIAIPGNGLVSLHWTAPPSTGGASIVNYKVQYSSDGGTNWTLFPPGASTPTSAVVTGLTNGTSYVFRVAAVNVAGTGDWSANSAAVTPRTVPSAPTAIDGMSGNSRFALSWAAPSNNGGAPITDYTIQYSTTGTEPWTSFPHSASTATAATVTGLTNGQGYVFRVAAVSAAGTGAFSDPTPAVTPLAAAPGRPVIVARNGFVDLRWAAPRLYKMPPITDYSIRYSADSGATWTIYPHAASAATSRRVILANGNTYIFQVAPVVSGGAGVYSPSSLPVTPFAPAAKPDAPINVVGVKRAAVISLSWNAVARSAGGPVKDYVIQYRVNVPHGRWLTYTDTVSPVTSASLRLRAGYSYVFRVAAKNLAGVGGLSAQSAPVTA